MSVGLFLFDVQSMKTQVTTWGIGIKELWTVSKRHSWSSRYPGLIFRKPDQFSEIVTNFDTTHCQYLAPFWRDSGVRLGARWPRERNPFITQPKMWLEDSHNLTWVPRGIIIHYVTFEWLLLQPNVICHSIEHRNSKCLKRDIR